jgi:hypothetical protein
LGHGGTVKERSFAIYACTIRGPKFRPPNVCRQIYAAKFMLPNLCRQIYAAKFMPPNICCQIYAAKFMPPNLCCQIYAAKYMLPNLCRQIYAAKFIPPNLCYLKVYTVLYYINRVSYITVPEFILLTRASRSTLPIMPSNVFSEPTPNKLISARLNSRKFIQATLPMLASEFRVQIYILYSKRRIDCP